jgi:3-oxoacyl-[acyl-carrier protein] reductase
VEWRDQVAAVTDDARGIGRATAWLLVQHGSAVCVNCVARADAAEAPVAEIAAGGGRAIGSSQPTLQTLPKWGATVARAETELGPPTILVNSAGVGTLDTYEREQVARMRQVNVEGVIHATREERGAARACPPVVLLQPICARKWGSYAPLTRFR